MHLSEKPSILVSKNELSPRDGREGIGKIKFIILFAGSIFFTIVLLLLFPDHVALIPKVTFVGIIVNLKVNISFLFT